MSTATSKQNSPITVNFDIGHSSLGWAVLSPTSSTPHPDILGCGTVIFPKDDCLASTRRGHRRSRRNIRATRQRISRIKKLLLHLGVLNSEELDAIGHPAPHVLASRALLTPKPTLTWLELWHVLRWYAHNRGYDGNSRWARHENSTDDTEKERAAKQLMDTHGTTTMAETVCAVLGINPSQTTKTSSLIAFKTLNAAFPRETVCKEVRIILERHKGHLPKLDNAFIASLIDRSIDANTPEVRGIKLPKRYQGGLLFGQLVPRFDNRIIPTCPISGHKVPNKDTKEFLEYRWTMLLANIRANGKMLSIKDRKAVHRLMVEKGRLTPSELQEKIVELTGSRDTNIKTSFEIHPDSKDALVLDPARAYYLKAAENTDKKDTIGIHLFWTHLPERTKKRALGRWRKGRIVNLEWMLAQCGLEKIPTAPLEAAIDATFQSDQKKKKVFITKNHLLRKIFAPETPSGRAPYSRSVMQKVVGFVLSTDRHPTEVDGPIYRSPGVLKNERKQEICNLTNNHLIRQRLTILLRLTRDILKTYADDNPARITDITVEVARDLQEYSGLSAKEMAGELTKRLSHFKSAVKYLEEHAPDLPITGSLIRKCRIAIDMNWMCPFTGKKYDAYSLPKMVREHIIPYADRPTNALDAQVLTQDWVNSLKGKRTAYQFILDMIDDDRFLSPKNYKGNVESLKVAKEEIYPDDHRRQSARKKWLMVEHYAVKDHGFTQGALTQTSHLNRMAHRQLEKLFTDPNTGDCTTRIHAIPGQVTAEARKTWNLLGTLVPACPECEGKTKTEIRDITHLHHALDAATLGLIHHYLPGTISGQPTNEKGAIWQALLKRNKTSGDINLLLQTGVFKRTKRTDQSGNERVDAILVDLPDAVKNQLASRLTEKRVVQHMPADQSGAVLEQNPWRVWRIQGDPSKQDTPVIIRQRTSTIENGRRIYKDKETTERAGKLVGLKSGKLQKNKSVLVISDNYGMALDPNPTIIPFHDVPRRLKAQQGENNGKTIRILRNGMLVKILSDPPRSQQSYKGIWRIESCKDNKSEPALDIIRPVYLKAMNGVDWSGMNKSINPLIKAGIELIRPPLTGIPDAEQRL